MGVRGLKWEQRATYGPISEGVTGSEGGGGRLMKVGVDIVRVKCLNVW